MRIRVVVVSQLARQDHNAMLHLLSASEELLRYGRAHYRPYSAVTSTLLYQLCQEYEERAMATDNLKEFVRQTIDELLAKLPAEERLKGLPAEELRNRLTPEERLKGLPPEELLKALSPEVRAALLRQLKSDETTANGGS